MNGANVELLEITKEGILYKISGVSYSNSTYYYTRTQLTNSKSEIEAFISDLQSQINDMQDGNVEGSLQDQINDMQDGSQSGSLQYQINTLNSNKVNKTQKVNGHALSGDITITKGDIGLGNVSNYSVESYAPSASGSQLYITSKAVYDALTSLNTTLQNAIDGKASVSDFNDLDARLDAIETLIGDNDGDDDNIINTLKEIISSLSGLGEDANILSMINSKADQTDFTALDNQINASNGIKDKVNFLWDRENAYCEIKNDNSTIDIETTDWVENSDADYPYKWELTNGYLTGATNAIVVFSVDSDTSLISTTIDIDEVNGKVIIYASDLPSDTISIEKIAVFNDLNAYINYSNTVVQNNMQNAAAIQEINNVKLPNYIQKNETVGLVKNDGTIDTTTYLSTTNASNTYVPVSSGTDKGSITNGENKIEIKYGSTSSLYYSSIITLEKGLDGEGIIIGQKRYNDYGSYIKCNAIGVGIYSSTFKWSTDGTTWKTLATLDDIPSLTNYIQKSDTSGLIKNDGTIDTTNYTTLNLVYPVGSIYMSVNNTSPASLFGGTWEQLKDRFLLGAGDTYSNGATGGEATHQLSVDEMPSHSHDFYAVVQGGYSNNGVLISSTWAGATTKIDNDNTEITRPRGVQPKGGGQAHNNMPPYLVVYMWKRVS